VKKILIDHQIFCYQKVGGISRYFVNIVKFISNKDNTNSVVYLSIKYSSNQYLKAIEFIDVREFFLTRKKFLGSALILEIINRFFTILKLIKGDYDVFFPTYYNNYFFPFLKKKCVITVHDMTHELYPDYFKSKRDFTLRHKKKAIMKADLLIAISENTKNDLIRIYNVSPKKIVVIHHGIEQNYEIKIVHNIPEKYFLFVGERQGYKNFELVLKSFHKINNKGLYLLCTGKYFTSSELILIKELNLENNVKVSFYEDEELNYLYENAKALIYPSIYEGFGFPLIEAMRAKCLVISSNQSCMPEIGGDSVIYFNPFNINDCVDSIQKVLNMDLNTKNLLIKKGFINLKRFDLKDSLNKTLNTLEGIS